MSKHSKHPEIPGAVPAKPVEAFRILHTADWHLGKLLNDQSRDEEHARFLDWLLGAVAEHAVDAVVLAGDVFDTANPPQSAQRRYYNFVSKLHWQGGCSLVVIGGNHDSAAQLEAPKQVLRALDVHVAGGMAEEPAERILLLPDDKNPRVGIAMMPFLRDRDLRAGRAGESADEIRAALVAGIRARYEESAEAWRSVGAGCPAIATGHLTVVGAKSSDSEREIHIGGLGAVDSTSFPEDFAYVALGHLHRPQSVGKSGLVRYAGSPIPLSFSEAGDAKEVRLLDVAPGNLVQHGLPVPQFRRLAQIRTSSAEMEEALGEFDPGGGDLPAWVEVVVEDAIVEDDLADRARAVAEGRGFEVLKVVRARSGESFALSADGLADDEAIESLLDEPRQVFDRLLDEHSEQFDESEREALGLAFDRLLELTQSEPEEETSR
jgi:exonuclease SbcD